MPFLHRIVETEASHVTVPQEEEEAKNHMFAMDTFASK